ncbi:hypothetical protein Aab01nite_26830 [Paractinoplanes abujensis]|uniref:Capsular exopolysaccharide synthesis family protein n=1 Tax=Paractinoplanes abujensis TaxID=882441 RepID=A0A7W7G6U1_9ACTN|nr:polysaccharide biosynthesis tyrosine autokinase [Actinoplanes abujensis]MBB4698422.1 capsular exopolysaccharide synthesis family protein [Actinoplanes abujensis]GID19093.1 hypothetical protein Aab01nite_26830 [Actinoplanes abujensis]
MELREYVRAARRRWAWIVVPVVLAAGIAAGLSLTQEPAYRSSMVLFVSTGAGDPDAKASRLNSYIALLTGPRVAQTVSARLNPPAPADQVRESLSAEVQAGTDLLVVSAKDPSAERSRTMVTNATAALVALAKKLDPPGTAADSGPPPQITVAQDAVTVQEPGHLARNIGFSAVLGLLVGGVGVAAREAGRKTVTEEDDLRRLGIGTVGVISLSGRWARSGQADSALAEAFRRLRSLLPADLVRGHGTALMITAAGPKEGTTAVSCGLAIAMAETGARVLLVDANLRSPGVGRYLSMGGGPGLADVLDGRARLNDVLRDPLAGRLTVLPPGEKRADPGEVLASPRLAATVNELTSRFDIVIVDAPPLHGVADAAVLGKVTDGALLVVRANRTRTADVQRSTDLLERVGAKLVGAVLNALPRKLPDTSAGAQPTVPAPMDSPGLITTLLGAPGERDEPMPPPNPVSGRARVAKTEITTADVSHAVITPRRPPDGPAPQRPYDGSVTQRLQGGSVSRRPDDKSAPRTPGNGSTPRTPDDGSTAQRIVPPKPRPVREDEASQTQAIIPPGRAVKVAAESVSLNGHGKAVVRGQAMVAEKDPAAEETTEERPAVDRPAVEKPTAGNPTPGRSPKPDEQDPDEETQQHEPRPEDE